MRPAFARPGVLRSLQRRPGVLRGAVASARLVARWQRHPAHRGAAARAQFSRSFHPRRSEWTYLTRALDFHSRLAAARQNAGGTASARRSVAAVGTASGGTSRPMASFRCLGGPREPLATFDFAGPFPGLAAVAGLCLLAGSDRKSTRL